MVSILYSSAKTFFLSCTSVLVSRGRGRRVGQGRPCRSDGFFIFYFLRSLLIVNNLSIEIIDVTINFLCVM